MAHWLSRETLLELGILTLAGGLLTALGVLVFGRAAGAAERRGRHAEVSPAPRLVPFERHQHIGGVSAR